MIQKKVSFIGLPISDFYSMIKEKSQINAQKAKLIPPYKIGDETALTSVFLSSLRLIKEFRKMIFSDISMKSGGKIHVFTEIEFKETREAKNKRIDGLICIVKAGKIIDAAFLEMKNGNNLLDEDQIKSYLEIACKYNVPKLITVSNQFVTHPTQTPLSIKVKNEFGLFHLSWSLILTYAHVLLTDNDTNIEDINQVEIMREVVDYMEHNKSGVVGFTKMKDGWTKLTERIHKKDNIKEKDEDVVEAVESWLQEEKDMALILSRKLGILVRIGNRKRNRGFKQRIRDEAESIAKNKYIESILKISDAASDVMVRADFQHRNIVFSTSLIAPQDRTLTRQITWIKDQLKKMEKKSPESFNKIKGCLDVTLKLKHKKKEIKSISELDDFAINNRGNTLKEYGIILDCDMGRNFGATKKSIKLIEEFLIDHYQGVVQPLTKWHKPAPEIKKEEVDIQ